MNEENTRRSILEELEGLRMVIPNPDDYSTMELFNMLKRERRK